MHIRIIGDSKLALGLSEGCVCPVMDWWVVLGGFLRLTWRLLGWTPATPTILIRNKWVEFSAEKCTHFLATSFLKLITSFKMNSTLNSVCFWISTKTTTIWAIILVIMVFLCLCRFSVLQVRVGSSGDILTFPLIWKASVWHRAFHLHWRWHLGLWRSLWMTRTWVSLSGYWVHKGLYVTTGWAP